MTRRSLQHEIGKRTPFESPEHEAWLNIARTASVLEGDFARLFKQHGLSGATYNTLRIIRGHLRNGSNPHGVPSQTIGSQLVTRVPDVTRLVDRLVGAGLVERERAASDKRVMLIKLTRKGLDLLARLDGPVMALHQRQLGHMSEPELRQLSELLVDARRECAKKQATD